MDIALDYDDTYTLKPEFWDAFIAHARADGNRVYIVTMRYEHEKPEDLEGKVDAIFCTGRIAKRLFMYSKGIHIHVWIDDRPEFILVNALP